MTVYRQQLTLSCMSATIKSIEAHLPCTPDQAEEIHRIYEELLDVQHQIVFGYERVKPDYLCVKS
jgi:hypothetical protein